MKHTKISLPSLKVNSGNNKRADKCFVDFTKAVEALENKYRIEVSITKQDIEENPTARFKKGQKVTRNPKIPKNRKKAFTLFKNYYAALYYETEKYLFKAKYIVWNESAIEAEIKIIADWIKEAEKLNYSDACVSSNGGIQNYYSPEHEYLRLKNGFYEGYLMDWEQQSESSLAAKIYGRYFLFYEFLKNKLTQFKVNEQQPQDMQMEMVTSNFYSEIAHQLYIYKYKIGDTNFFNEVDFIEAKHNQTPYKGKVFYINLIHAMPPICDRLADVSKGEKPTSKEKIFKRSYV